MTDADLAPQRKAMIHAESAVQKGVYRASRRVIACEHEFASHDRGKEGQDGSHVWALARGFRSAWPDTELVCATGLTANVELKKPGWKPPREGTAAWPHWRDQRDMLARLTALGRVAGVATSVLECVEIWAAGGIPLHPNWRAIAAHEDELVAADIRNQEAKRDGTKPRGKPFRGNKVRSMGRVAAVRARVMF